jgi:hypothetical protein
VIARSDILNISHKWDWPIPKAKFLTHHNHSVERVISLRSPGGIDEEHTNDLHLDLESHPIKPPAPVGIGFDSISAGELYFCRGC